MEVEEDEMNQVLDLEEVYFHQVEEVFRFPWESEKEQVVLQEEEPSIVC